MSTPGLFVLSGFSAGFRARRIEGWSQGSAAGRPRERPKVLDVGPVRRTLARRRRRRSPPYWVVVASPSPVPRLWTLPCWVSVIPSPREAAWSVVRQHDQRGQSSGATTPAGGHDYCDPRRP